MIWAQNISELRSREPTGHQQDSVCAPVGQHIMAVILDLQYDRKLISVWFAVLVDFQVPRIGVWDDTNVQQVCSGFSTGK